MLGLATAMIVGMMSQTEAKALIAEHIHLLFSGMPVTLLISITILLLNKIQI